MVTLARDLEETRTETATVDFKAGFDTQSLREWCEVIKDLVSMANSEGGIIIFGVNDAGTASSADLSELTKLDPATITDKLAKYIGRQFSGFRLQKTSRGGAPVVVLEIEPSPVPFVFTAPGTYVVPNPTGKQQQKTAFGQGTIYFRHGAKSEPAVYDDLRMVVDREVERLRSSWLDGIQRVVTAPTGSVVRVLPPEVKLDSAALGATPVRLTHDPSAPTLNVAEFDALYPYRQKEVINRLATLLPGVKVTPFDIQCIRRFHGLDADPTYSAQTKFGSRQYSEAFIDLIVVNYTGDEEYFQKAKEALKRPEAGPTSSR